MVGVVVVSHSRPLAEAAVGLALQMAHATPPAIEIAAGLDGGVLGTDAARVKEAIDRVASPDGVLVVMDLGSAVLSAQMAMEMRETAGDGPVVLSDAPLVEGLVAAVALAAAGAPLAEVAAEASRAGHTKATLVGPAPASPVPEPSTVGEAPAPLDLVIDNEHGLHARPAARFVGTARRFDAHVTVRNLSSPGPAVSGLSLSALSTLGVLAGHRVEVAASGPEAREVLAALSALVRRNFDEPPAGETGGATETTAPPAGPPGPAGPAGGGPVAASPGIGIGPKTSIFVPTHQVTGALPDGRGTSERERLSAALEIARSELAGVRGRVARAAGEAEAAIFDAHLLLLDDEGLAGRALGLIEAGGVPAAQAWQAAVNELAARFSALPDAYMRARADDVRAVGEQVLGHLRGTPAPLAERTGGVVVADDLTPAQVAGLDPGRVVGLVMASGSAVSHASILARALGIPAVVGEGQDILSVADGTIIVVDGYAGTVVVSPSPSIAEQYRREVAVERSRAAELLERASMPAITTDGQRVEVCANIGSRDDAVEAVKCGADGVGLLRTELLFLDRAGPPGEDEQAAAYISIARALEGRRLTIRTLDIGGDKPAPYLSQRAEANPFLGRRGLRLSLGYPGLFKAQLRAIVRTAKKYPVSVLFPMVTTVDELRSARRLLVESANESGCEPGSLPTGMEIGAMAEVPAFALRAAAMVPMLDVISIGSNDLTQYTLAAERGNPEVASLADPLDPAVLRLIGEVAQAAGPKLRVAVCGEMANDPPVAVLLMGLGVRELSMSPRAIPEVKRALRAVSGQKARQLAETALRAGSAAGVRALLAGIT
jgi:multiphosphoryl transfer protein